MCSRHHQAFDGSVMTWIIRRSPAATVQCMHRSMISIMTTISIRSLSIHAACRSNYRKPFNTAGPKHLSTQCNTWAWCRPIRCRMTARCPRPQASCPAAPVPGFTRLVPSQAFVFFPFAGELTTARRKRHQASSWRRMAWSARQAA